MKKILFVLALVMSAAAGMAQVQFTCDKIYQTIEDWNNFAQFPNEIEWARGLAKTGRYSVNDKGDIEYEFIIHASDTLDVATLKDVTIDYIQYYFNINNVSRANLIQGSTDRSIFFQGYLSKYAYLHNGWGSIYYFASNINFDFKFKEDRIKITVQVPELIYHVDKYQFSYKLQELDPFVNYKKYKRDEKDVQAKAMVNLLSKTISYPKFYIEFLNANYNKSIVIEEDW